MQASKPSSLQSRSAASICELVSPQRHLTPRPPFLSCGPHRVITRVNGAKIVRHVMCLALSHGTWDVLGGHHCDHHHYSPLILQHPLI